MPAEEAFELIDGRLQYFGLERKRHIIGAVTDGALMMKTRPRGQRCVLELKGDVDKEREPLILTDGPTVMS